MVKDLHSSLVTASAHPDSVYLSLHHHNLIQALARLPTRSDQERRVPVPSAPCDDV